MAKPIASRIVKYEPKIVPATTLQVQYTDGVKEFVFPLTQGNYQTSGNTIREAHFHINEQDVNSSGRTRLAKADEYLDFLRACYTNPQLSQDADAETVRITMKNLWHWLFQGTLTTSKTTAQRGIYVFDDPLAQGISASVKESDLAQRLEGGTQTSQGVIFSPDKTVRFAPRGTYAENQSDGTGYQFKTLAEAEQDGFQIAFCGGEEGAQAFAEIAGLKQFFRNMPRSWKLDCENNQGKQRVSVLNDLNGDGLFADGNNSVGSGSGYALGVCE